MQNLATLLVILASLVPQVQAAQTYVFDSVHSTPTFEFKHLALTTQSGHFDNVRGTVTLDRAARSGSVHFSVEAASLNMGVGTATPASAGFALLKVGSFPTIDYQSEQLFFDDQQRVVAATGSLTLLGVSKPVTVWVKHFACAISTTLKVEMCAANITASLRRSEYGMQDYIPAISDEVRLEIPVEAYLQTGDNAQ